jgi:translocation and assembly module TamB
VGQSTLQGSAHVDADGAFKAQLAAEDARVADVAPLLGLDPARVPLQGRGKISLSAHGVAEQAELAIELALSEASVAGVELGTLDASLELRDGGQELHVLHANASEHTRTIATEGLRLRWPSGALEANGKVALARFALADLYRALGARDDALLSRLQADARGQIELAHGAGVQKLSLALELAQPSLDGHDFDSGKLDAQVSLFEGAEGSNAHSALELKALELRSGQGRLALDGKVARGGALELHATLQGVPLSRLTGSDWPWSVLHATASGEGTFGGSVQEPRAKLALELDDVQFGGIALGRQPLTLQLARAKAADAVPGCEVALRALGELNGGAWLLCGGRNGAKIDLALGTAPSRPLRGRVELDGVDISRWLPADRDGDALPGTLSAALSLDAGGLAAPQSISGKLEVRALALGKGPHALHAPAPFALRIAHGAVKVENGQLVGERIQLTLGAQGTLPDVRLTADGAQAANTLAKAGLIPLVREAYGDVGVHIEVAPGHTPLLRAALELRDLIVHVGPDLIVNKVRGKITVADNQAEIEQILGDVGGGTIELGGDMQLGGLSLTRYDIALAATKVALEPQPRFEIAFDAKTRLQSGEKGRPPKVSGAFKVAHLLYGRHIQLPEALVAMNKNDRGTRAAYDPARDKLLVDITIEHSEPLIVRNNFMDAELSLRGAERTLRVVGSDQRFGLLGELAIDRGRVMYHGDEFLITRGAVSFADPERVDPVFDLRAIAQKHTRPDASIVFSARGDRDAFQIDVRCDAGSTPLAIEPFDCDFAHDKLRCDDFNKLVEQFACRPKTELSER